MGVFVPDPELQLSGSGTHTLRALQHSHPSLSQRQSWGSKPPTSAFGCRGSHNFRRLACVLRVVATMASKDIVLVGGLLPQLCLWLTDRTACNETQAFMLPIDQSLSSKL